MEDGVAIDTTSVIGGNSTVIIRRRKGDGKVRVRKIFDAESLEDYEPGGFHPIHIGDGLGEGGRFRVAHKLGYGGYGTVWLCRDTVNGVWRAVKVIAARDSDDESCREWTTLKELDGLQSEAEACHIALPIEHFFIDGPNGRHLCLVSCLYGPPLVKVWAEHGDDVEMLKWICFQLVEGMAFLHSRGICHGDFRSSNVLRRLRPGFDTMSDDEMATRLSPFIKVESPPGYASADPRVPKYRVATTELRTMPGDVTSDIAIIDFGQSYLAAEPTDFIGIPTANAAPEIIFGALDVVRSGFATDIWALASAICEVRLGYSPFGYDLKRTSADLECCLGPIPEPYRSTLQVWSGGWEQQSKLARKREEDKRRQGTRMDEYGTDDWLASVAGRRRSFKRIPGDHRVYIHRNDHLLTPPGLSEETLVKPDEGKKAAQAAEAPHNNAGRSTEASVAGNQHTPPQGPQRTGNPERVEVRVPREELSEFIDLLRTMFRYFPEYRADVWSVAKHPYFTGCGPLRVTDPAEESQIVYEDISLTVGCRNVRAVVATMAARALGCGVSMLIR